MDYTPPPQAAWEAMANGPEVTAAVTEAAEKAKVFAEGLAPRRTGHYAASFDVQVAHEMAAGRKRAVARLVNSVGYAAALEWGNRQTHGRSRRILGRTLAALRSL